ncbi:hypothetical protein BFC17_15095 [Alteromonas lipolytica]|uniref:diguanylate cyclase n=2 Tax=Alteromonas lipolytica TaxID=1856405 RepID=A0A1E8FHF3_9ALTE|nr:hypothetical protein BFC17_15095 [Alteromonas lipolytica]
MHDESYTTLKTFVFTSRSLSDCRVLVVDDERSSCLLISTILEGVVNCECLHHSENVFALCEQDPPDLIILDINMPGKNGIDLCHELKSQRSTAQCAIIFITGSSDAETQDKCWNAGANDFIKKPVVASTLIHRVKNQLQSQLRLELLSELTFKDQLTELYNRYYLMTEIPTLIKRIAREKASIGVIMLDIDFFKGFNDQYGHIAGDKCLHQVAKAMQQQLLRPQDAIIRYGGEEFAVILPFTDDDGCRHVGRKLLKAVANLNIVNATSQLNVVTVSAGYYVDHPDQNARIEDMIDQADQALYRAKQSGRACLQGPLPD